MICPSKLYGHAAKKEYRNDNGQTTRRFAVLIILADVMLECMGMAGSRAVAWVLVVSQVFVRALCSDSVSDSAVGWARSFFGLRLFYSALVQGSRWEIQQLCVVLHSCWLIPGKSLLSGHRWSTILTSLCTHVVTCMCICLFLVTFVECACFTQANTYFMCQKCYTAKSFL